MGFTGNEVAFQFAQVGDDQKATDFLDSLDNHPEVGRFVDATSNYEREAEQWSRPEPLGWQSPLFRRMNDPPKYKP